MIALSPQTTVTVAPVAKKSALKPKGTEMELKQYQKDFKKIMSLSPVKSQDACLDEYCVKNRDTGKVLGPVLSERVQGDRTNKEAVLSFVFNNEGVLIGAEVYVPSIKETFSFMQNATDELE